MERMQIKRKPSAFAQIQNPSVSLKKLKGVASDEIDAAAGEVKVSLKSESVLKISLGSSMSREDGIQSTINGDVVDLTLSQEESDVKPMREAVSWIFHINSCRGEYSLTDLTVESLYGTNWLSDWVVDFLTSVNLTCSEYRDEILIWDHDKIKNFFHGKSGNWHENAQKKFFDDKDHTANLNVHRYVYRLVRDNENVKHMVIPVCGSGHFSVLILPNIFDSDPIKVILLDSINGFRNAHSVVTQLSNIICMWISYRKKILTSVGVYIPKRASQEFHVSPDELSETRKNFSAEYFQCAVPQQPNGYDCGICAVLFIQRFLMNPSHLYMSTQGFRLIPCVHWETFISKGVQNFTPEYLVEARKHFIKIINALHGFSKKFSNSTVDLMNQRYESLNYDLLVPSLKMNWKSVSTILDAGTNVKTKKELGDMI